jgi:hypothetical protein
MVNVPENGCIFLSRSILNSKVFRNEKWLKVWIWCLLKANHKEISLPVKTGRGNTVIQIKRGQFLYGRHSASRALDMPASTIRNIIVHLVRWENLDIQADTHYSIITVLNYDTYQDINTYRRTGKRTTKGQPKDTNNNDKNDNNIYMCGFKDFWKVYPPRNGRKLGKGETQKVFTTLRMRELENVVLAAKNYAESKDVQDGIGIRDPKRFLKDDYWKEWIDASRPKRFDEVGH